MGNKVLFREFLKRSKIPIEIGDSTLYKRVTIKIKHGGVSLRDTEIGKKIGTKKQFILKSGQFILSKIDARYGAFGIAPEEVNDAIITGNFWAYDVDFNKININWFNQFTNSKNFYDLCERASSGITHRKYLSEDKFLDNEVYLPSIEEQKLAVHKINEIKDSGKDIDNELTHQLSLISQLRQAFLREATQGTLVSNETKDGATGAQLLAEIKKEKEQLVKEKKIKKQKPLAPISNDEIPFEIPENWVWCRLDEVSINCDNARKPISKKERDSLEKKFDYYGASGVIDKIHDFTHEGKFLLIGEDGNNLISRSTPLAFIAEGKFWVNNHAHVLKYTNDTLLEYMKNWLNIFEIKKYLTGGFQPKFSQMSMNLVTVPLPPLEIQERIVAQLDELMQYCDALEAQVKDSRALNEQLLQQVLREALEDGSKKDEEVLPMVAEDTPLYSLNKEYNMSDMAILAGHIINTLSTSNEKDFGRVKLQKMLHLVQFHCNLDAPLQYKKKVAGPYCRDLESQLEQKLQQLRFFDIKKEKIKEYEQVVYTKLASSKELDRLFADEFEHKADEINNLLQKFRSKNTNFCEAVSTMYAVWNNRLLNKEAITDELLKTDFLKWDESKKKFIGKLDDVLDWMRKNDVVPTGFGKII